LQLLFLTLTDILVLSVAYVYVISIIGLGELLRRLGNYSPAVTRKFIHLGAGFSAFTVPFYSQAWAAIIVALSFLILIFLASPKSPIKSLKTMFEVMAREEDYLSGHIWGPFLYAISITVLVSIFTLIPALTPYFVLPATGLTAMYLGDGLAPIIGMKYGKHHYTIGKATRSIEGSITVFIASLFGAIFCFIFFDWFASGGFPLFTLEYVIILSLICAIVAAIIEGISPPGIDNLTVPILTALITFSIAILLYPPLLALITNQ
jgi:phytol kinase